MRKVTREARIDPPNRPWYAKNRIFIHSIYILLLRIFKDFRKTIQKGPAISDIDHRQLEMLTLFRAAHSSSNQIVEPDNEKLV